MKKLGVGKEKIEEILLAIIGRLPYNKFPLKRNLIDGRIMWPKVDL
jgi:hypothetical protein